MHIQKMFDVWMKLTNMSLCVNKPQLPDFGIHDTKSRLLLFINLFIQFSSIS